MLMFSIDDYSMFIIWRSIDFRCCVLGTIALTKQIPHPCMISLMRSNSFRSTAKITTIDKSCRLRLNHVLMKIANNKSYFAWLKRSLYLLAISTPNSPRLKAPVDDAAPSPHRNSCLFSFGCRLNLSAPSNRRHSIETWNWMNYWIFASMISWKIANKH